MYLNMLRWVCVLVLVFVTACAHPKQYKPTKRGPDKDFGGVYHVIEKGQTLWRISRAYGVDLETVQWVNDIDDVTSIPIGKKLFIPGAKKVLKVVPYRPGEVDPLVASPIINFLWPLKVPISSGFGPRRNKNHHGVDLPAPSGSRFVASAGGKVAYSGQGMKGYGKVIVLKHTGELSTVYAHNSTNLVRMGDRVVKGQVIGRVGKTGWATGPHVHFEIRKRGIAQNPLNYLR